MLRPHKLQCPTKNCLGEVWITTEPRRLIEREFQWAPYGSTPAVPYHADRDALDTSAEAKHVGSFPVEAPKRCIWSLWLGGCQGDSLHTWTPQFEFASLKCKWIASKCSSGAHKCSPALWGRLSRHRCDLFASAYSSKRLLASASQSSMWTFLFRIETGLWLPSTFREHWLTWVFQLAIDWRLRSIVQSFPFLAIEWRVVPHPSPVWCPWFHWQSTMPHCSCSSWRSRRESNFWAQPRRGPTIRQWASARCGAAA